MLHSLLIPESLTFLSVASNRRLKLPAFRLISAYVAKVCAQSATSNSFTDIVLGQTLAISGSFTK